MMLAVVLIVTVIFGLGAVLLICQAKLTVVPEDSIAITIDHNGFINRVLPAGRHILRPFEKVDFSLEVEPKFTTGQAVSVVTSDGISTNVSWSGMYVPKPELISDHRSRYLRGLVNAQRLIAPKVDIALRKAIGDYTVQSLFKPSIRERIEQQVRQVVTDKIRPLGLVLNSYNLQVIDIPAEVAEALNKARAIEALDDTIRDLDPATRHIVHFDQYLLSPSGLLMNRFEAISGEISKVMSR